MTDVLDLAPVSCREAVERWARGEDLAVARVFAYETDREAHAQDAILSVVRKILDDGGARSVAPLRMAQLEATTRVVLFSQVFMTGQTWNETEERAIRGIAGAAIMLGWRTALAGIHEREPDRVIILRKPRAEVAP